MKDNDKIDLLYKNHNVEYAPNDDVWEQIEYTINSLEDLKSNNYTFGFRAAVVLFVISSILFSIMGYSTLIKRSKPEYQYKMAIKELKEAEKSYAKAKNSFLLLAKNENSSVAQSVIENINIIDNAIAEVKLVYEKDPGNKELFAFIGSMYFEQTALLLKTQEMFADVAN